jgi:transcriptional regulator
LEIVCSKTGTDSVLLGRIQAYNYSHAPEESTEGRYPPRWAWTLRRKKVKPNEHIRFSGTGFNPGTHFRLTSYLDSYIFELPLVSKADSLQGALDLLVLKILFRRCRLHGYAIMEAINEMSGSVLHAEEGSLYPALHRLEESGWLRAEWFTKDTWRRVRLYELTAAGKQQLAVEESRWLSVTSAVHRVLRTV